MICEKPRSEILAQVSIRLMTEISVRNVKPSHFCGSFLTQISVHKISAKSFDINLFEMFCIDHVSITNRIQPRENPQFHNFDIIPVSSLTEISVRISD